ncbi:MAG TPA: asparaginase [Bdellovibrionales bacterium]|nr:asparaginase [Bdellovibrionales bacterium]
MEANKRTSTLGPKLFYRANTRQGGWVGPRKIQIVTTGGTIEKVYDEVEGQLTNKTPNVEMAILSKLRLPYTEPLFHQLMNKDSLFMDDKDRKQILDKVRALAPEGHPILIIHGTDTMTLTAELLARELTDLKVAIAFTGAMRPLGFDDSDAMQNVTEALMALKILPPGVYISFHNQIFRVPGVRKNKEKRTFEWV